MKDVKDVEEMTDAEIREDLKRMVQSLSADDQEAVMALIEILQRRAVSLPA